MTIVQLTTDNREPFRQYDNPEPHFGPAPEALLQGFALHPQVIVHVVSCTQQPMLASPEKLAPNIWFHSLHVPKLGWIRTGYAGCVRAIRRKVRGIAPDVVHGQGTERECAMSAVFSGFPNVLTIHGNMSEIAKYEQALFGKFYAHCAAIFERLALGRTEGVFCNSHYTEQIASRRVRKTWRVPNALRRPFFEAPVNSQPGSLPILLNIGVISPRKQQVALLDLAHELHEQGGAFLLRFVGALNTSDAYGKAFAKKLEIAKKGGYAEHAGTRSTNELIAMLDSASALLHVPKEEAFGLVVGEALARNLKLFALRVGGVTDIASGVEGAELFAPQSWPEMTAAIRNWLFAGAPRPTQASEIMRARYHPAVIAQRHLEIYREVLSNRAP